MMPSRIIFFPSFEYTPTYSIFFTITKNHLYTLHFELIFMWTTNPNLKKKICDMYSRLTYKHVVLNKQGGWEKIEIQISMLIRISMLDGMSQSCEEEVLVWVFPNHESKTYYQIYMMNFSTLFNIGERY